MLGRKHPVQMNTERLLNEGIAPCTKPANRISSSGSRVYGREEDDAAEVGKPNTWRYDTLTKPCNPLVSWMFYALVKVK